MSWYPVGGNGGLPSFMLTKEREEFARLKTQGFTLNQQFITDGLGFTTNWIEREIVSGTSRYAAFDIPSGYYMALDYRLINTRAEQTWYHVYPSGTYTLGAAKANIPAEGFAKTRNLRQDSGFVANPLVRYNVTSAPTRITDSIVDEIVFGVAGAQSGVKSEGQLAPDDTFLLLTGGQQFLLELHNNGAATESAQVQLNYAFVPDSMVSPSEV